MSEAAQFAGVIAELDCSRTINFAMQQNDVPVVRQLRVINRGAAPIENLRVHLASEPAFFPPWETTIASVGPGATFALGPVDLRLSPDYLIGLTERVAGAIHAEVGRDGDVLARRSEPIEMLAFDEWSGVSNALPELLAAFVLPNHPVVEGLLADAAKWLGDKTANSALSGYQSRSVKRVANVAKAVYAAIQRRGLSYCNPPASFESAGQKIRLPDRIMENGLATCLDLAALAAGCLEQAGLFPLVVMTRGHAFAGVWLAEECFADCLIDDLPRLRKRIDLNEILVFESTLTTSTPPAEFAAAVATGKRHLAEARDFHCAIDIQRCRRSRIRPLPVRSESGGSTFSPGRVEAPAGDAVFDVGATAGIAMPGQATQTPAGRLETWKRKLLDLTLHNRLINFKQSKKTVRILCPDVTTLEDALADGLEFQVLPRPTEFAAESGRSADLHHARTGADAVKQMLVAEFESRRLRADVPEQELRPRLTEIYRAARTATEEGGASTLYLAMGFLQWYETESTELARLAPILLVPVELRRTSVREAYRLSQSDEEPRVNITLLEMLARDFDLRIPAMDPIPQDERGIDVRGVLNTFRQAIKETTRWDVIEDVQLGLFSFTKFLMWRDLDVRTDDLLRNKVVDHLVNRPHESFPDDGVFPDQDRLDQTHRPHDTFCPLPSDSSQLAAVYAAATPKSFVLFGPPGTGKSQTITNLIAHSLATGKSVLFVSEKMAALNVVHARLTKCGLAPFCLELHSNKSHKHDVVAQLGEALDFRAARRPEEWEREADRLTSLRSELNAYVEALHRPRNFGESVFQATSRLIGLRCTPVIDLNLASSDAVTREQLDAWHELIEQVETAAAAAGHPATSVWASCAVETWSPAVQRGIEANIAGLDSICAHVERYAQQLGPPLGLGTAWNVGHLEFADRLLRLLTTTLRPPQQLLTVTDWDSTETAIQGWTERGRKRDALRQTLYARYEHQILDLDLDDLSRRLTTALASWFLPRWLGVRSIGRALRSVAQGGRRPESRLLPQDLSDARALRDEHRRLVAADEQGRALLGELWSGGDPDWNSVAGARDWVSRFRKLALAAAGGHADKAAALRGRWLTLVGDSDDALAPGSTLGQAAHEFLGAYAEFVAARSSFESQLVAAPTVWGAEPKRIALAEVRARLAEWRTNLSGLRAWCNWRRVRSAAVQAGLERLIAVFEIGLPATELRRSFDRSFYEWWVEAATQRDPLLEGFFSPEHERKIQQFRQIDQSYAKLTRAVIQATVAARRPPAAERVNEESEIGILSRQRQLQRGHMPVRRLFQRIPHLLHRLKPCVLMSPISVAQYLDPSHPAFDLVVFDEASQMPAWDAVGAIARGREVVVVGDPKQLPPTSFFMRSEEDEPGDDEVVEDLESVLDDCIAARLPQLKLRWHYRSRHESLIAFSNAQYYGNELLTFPSPKGGMGVSYRHVADGVYDKGKSRTNRAEADAVVAEVLRRLRDPDLARLSIGVVTFSVAQQTLVEDLLDEARQRFPEFERFFERDDSEPVMVKNLESVQGDERDVILFSVCYGPDADQRVSMNLGPLNRDGGERRLNVAVTRARQEVIVFATLKADHINLARTRARGVRDLKLFLDYAERGPRALSQALACQSGPEFDSPFEQDVCGRLRQRGHEVHTQVGCSGYRIDLAVVDPAAPGRYLLGIECDGANYHSAKTARDRDRLREDVLVGLGWRLHRVWSSDWWANPDECLSKIETRIAQTRTAPVSIPTAEAVEQSDSVDDEADDSEPQRDDSQPRNLSVYQAFRVRRRRGDAPEDFYLPLSESRIVQLIEQVVQAEGPVALEVVGRRVAAHWELGRLGANIRARIDQLARGASVRRMVHGEQVFLWPRNLDPASYATFRTPGMRSEEQRDIEEIPPEEIAAAAVHVLTIQLSLPVDQLIRETALVLGFGRTGRTIQKCIGDAIDVGARRALFQIDSDSRVRLAIQSDFPGKSGTLRN